LILAFLLDTSVTILLRDGDAATRQRLLKLDEAPSISVVTRVELEGGVHARPEFAPQRRAAVDAILAELDQIDFDERMAAAYGAIVASAGFSRRKIVDRMIAATALVQGLGLITANAADFRDVPGLTLEEW
jgi:tRNA(fMet)-specific endonuclease VapC